jgi:hypothetical protein
MAAGSAILAIKIIADSRDATKAFDETGKGLDQLGSTMTSMAVPALAVVGAFGAMAVAAAEDEAEQQKLTAAIAAAGAATAESTAQVEAAIVAGQARAFTDSEVRAGMQDLVTATGSVSEATALMAAAQDIARLSGVSLETASAAVAKAHEGNGAALAKLIPGLDKGANAQETLANATALAAGQADAYAASAPGQMAIVGDSFGELGEEVGSVFLPILKDLIGIVSSVTKVLQDLIGIVSSVTKVLQENSGAVKAVAVVVGVLAAGILAANVAIAAYNAIMAAVRIATVAWTVAQTALNLVLSLNPIGIVIIAITALIAAFVLAYQNSETFRNIVDGVFNAVVGFVQTAVATISRVIGTLTAILQAPFKAFEGMVRTVMDTVTGLVQAAVSTINSILDGIRGAIDTVANAVDSINPFAALPPPAAAPAVAGTARGTRRTALSRGARTGEAAAAGNLTVNVYGGDPWRIEQAVRRGYRGWTAGSGKGAPRREY